MTESIFAPGYPPIIKALTQEEIDNSPGGYIIGCSVCPCIAVTDFNPIRQHTWKKQTFTCWFCGNSFTVRKKPKTKPREGFYLHYIGANKEVIRLLAKRRWK